MGFKGYNHSRKPFCFPETSHKVKYALTMCHCDYNSSYLPEVKKICTKPSTCVCIADLVVTDQTANNPNILQQING